MVGAKAQFWQGNGYILIISLSLDFLTSSFPNQSRQPATVPHLAHPRGLPAGEGGGRGGHEVLEAVLEHREQLLHAVIHVLVHQRLEDLQHLRLAVHDDDVGIRGLVPASQARMVPALP